MNKIVNKKEKLDKEINIIIDKRKTFEILKALYEFIDENNVKLDNNKIQIIKVKKTKKLIYNYN